MRHSFGGAMKSFFAVLLLVVVSFTLADDSGKLTCEPEDGSKESFQPFNKEKMPKFFNEYPEKVTKGLFHSCLTAGEKAGFDKDMMEDYCACHSYLILEALTYREFSDLMKLSMKIKAEFFLEVSRACNKLGYTPEKAQPAEEPKQKRTPRPENPLRSAEGSFVT
jgi:hypothetical protein